MVTSSYPSSLTIMKAYSGLNSYPTHEANAILDEILIEPGMNPSVILVRESNIIAPF
jgi:hypothetical protein